MHKESGIPGRKIFYGWFVVAMSFAITTAGYSAYYLWPVFYVAILNDFGWSRADTALIFSIASIIYAFTSPVVGIIYDKFGPRRLFSVAAVLLALGVIGCSRAHEVWQFYIFFGLFVGLGTISAGYVPNAALVSAWFDKKRSTALGISMLGTRDVFLLTPVFQLIILAMGWRNSYLVLAAAVAIIIIPLAQFLRARPQDMGLLPDGATEVEGKGEVERSGEDARIVDRKWASTEWTQLRVIKQYQFWAFFLMMLGSGLIFSSLVNHFVALATDIGFTALFGANLILVYAVTSMIGRVSGFISDLVGREVAITLSLILTLITLAILLFTNDTSTPMMLYIAVAFWGFGNGIFAPAYTASTADLFHGKTFASVIGCLNVGVGVSASVGTWLFGYIFDVTGTYTLAIVITMFGVGAMIVGIWIAAPRKVRRVSGRAPGT